MENPAGAGFFDGDFMRGDLNDFLSKKDI